VYELKEQEALLQARLESVKNMISCLQIMNKEDTRDSNEIRAFVQDMLRVFSHDHKQETHFASELSGDVSSTDAYKALNVKAWKPAVKT
jgi:hypothetical protein